MNLKPKIPPQSPLAYWWNEFLFARSFVYTSPLLPDDCQFALHGIAHPAEGHGFWGNLISKTVDIQPVDGDDSQHFRFLIRLNSCNRDNRYDGTTLAEAEGTIIHDDASRETVIQGRTKFGASNSGALVCGMLLALAVIPYGWTTNHVEYVLILPLFIGLLIYQWSCMYSDRNSLTELIGTKLAEAERHQQENAEQFLKRIAGVVDTSMQDADESSNFFRKRR